jgi:hypothetical protein
MFFKKVHGPCKLCSPSVQPNTPRLACALLSRYGERAIGALKAPEEECIVGMPLTVHAYIASKAPRHRECDVWKGLGHLEIYMHHRSATVAQCAQCMDVHLCQAGE